MKVSPSLYVIIFPPLNNATKPVIYTLLDSFVTWRQSQFVRKNSVTEKSMFR